MKSVIIFLTAVILSSMHPFYLSVVDLKYNSKEKALQGTVKMFVNDLENALTKTSGLKVDLLHPKDTNYTKTLLTAYLEKRLSFNINQLGRKFKVLGLEKEEENFCVFIEVDQCPAPKKLEIENSILFDFLKEQINIVHLEVNGVKRSQKMTNPDKKFSFIF